MRYKLVNETTGEIFGQLDSGVKFVPGDEIVVWFERGWKVTVERTLYVTGGEDGDFSFNPLRESVSLIVKVPNRLKLLLRNKIAGKLMKCRCRLCGWEKESYSPVVMCADCGTSSMEIIRVASDGDYE